MSEPRDCPEPGCVQAREVERGLARQGEWEPGEPDMPAVSAEWVHSQRAERLQTLEHRLEESHKERRSLERALEPGKLETEEIRALARDLWHALWMSDEEGAHSFLRDHPWLRPEVEEEE